MDDAISKWIRDTQEGMKMSRDRDDVRDGESIIVSAGKVFDFECCDCGLVHSIRLSYDPGKGLVCMMLEKNEVLTESRREPMKERREGIFERWESGIKS